MGSESAFSQGARCNGQYLLLATYLDVFRANALHWPAGLRRIGMKLEVAIYSECSVLLLFFAKGNKRTSGSSDGK